LEEIFILQDLLEHQEVANASPSQEDLYILPCKDFKLIGCSVQKLMYSKVEVPKCETGHSSSSSSSRTLVVYGSDIKRSATRSATNILSSPCYTVNPSFIG
jgi:hypothetical protein